MSCFGRTCPPRRICGKCRMPDLCIMITYGLILTARATVCPQVP
jgi:hypothetical protein